MTIGMPLRTLATPEPIKVADEPEGEAHQDRREGHQPGRYVAFQMAEVAVPKTCSPTSCG